MIFNAGNFLVQIHCAGGITVEEAYKFLGKDPQGGLVTGSLLHRGPEKHE